MTLIITTQPATPRVRTKDPWQFMALSCELLQLVKHYGIAKTPTNRHQTMLKPSEAAVNKLALLVTMQTTSLCSTLLCSDPTRHDPLCSSCAAENGSNLSKRPRIVSYKPTQKRETQLVSGSGCLSDREYLSMTGASCKQASPTVEYFESVLSNDSFGSFLCLPVTTFALSKKVCTFGLRLMMTRPPLIRKWLTPKKRELISIKTCFTR